MATDYASNIRFSNRGSRKGEIWLYGIVGRDPDDPGAMSADEFKDRLKDLGQVDVINLRINSPGGSVKDGFAIYNLLRSHPARIEVDVDSMAASIASVIAMAGDEIRMADNATMMIHDPYGIVAGGAEEMRKTADVLDMYQGLIADTYVKRTKSDVSAVTKMMNAETWMTAPAAAALGFADAVTAEERVAAWYNEKIFRHFNNVPNFIVPGSRPRRDRYSVKLAAMDRRIAG